MAREVKHGGEQTGHSAPVLKCVETRELLKSAAFNCIALGQWEAACASILSSARTESGGSSREDPRELLETLALDRASFW